MGYRRISYFICYYFYKNIILVFTEFYFAYYNGFSGQIFFPDFYSLLYNAVYTSWPCILCYSFERDVDEEISMNYPILYRAGQIQYYFNLKRIWVWIVLGFFHGMINFFTTQYGLDYFLSFDGLTKDHWFKSSVSFICIIHLVTYKPFVDLMHWNWVILYYLILNRIMTPISILFFYIVTILLCIPQVSFIFQNEVDYKIFDILSYFKTWLILIFLPILSLYFDIVLRMIQYNFFSTPADIIFKNKDYYLYMIEENKRNQELNNQTKKNGQEDSYVPLVKNDLSRIMHIENNNRNNDLNELVGYKIKKIEVEQEEATSRKKREENHEYLVENIMGNRKVPKFDEQVL